MRRMRPQMRPQIRPPIEYTKEKRREKHQQSMPTRLQYSLGYENFNPYSQRHRELFDEPDDDDEDIPACDQRLLDRCGFTVDVSHRLGSGAYGKVYAVDCNRRAVRFWNTGQQILTQSFVGRRAAVKHIHFHTGDREMYRTIRRELRIIAGLRHPNIVEVFDVFAIRVRAYVVMEFCPDGTLQNFHDRCEAGSETLTESVFFSLVRQISDALLYLHDANVKHGDLALHNIMVFKRQNYNDIRNPNRILLKVIDFGYSHFLGGTQSRAFVKSDLVELGRIMERLAGVVRGMSEKSRKRIDRAVEDLVTKSYDELREAIVADKFLHPEEHARLMAGQEAGRRSGGRPNWIKRDANVPSGAPNLYRRRALTTSAVDGREYSVGYERPDVKSDPFKEFKYLKKWY